MCHYLDIVFVSTGLVLLMSDLDISNPTCVLEHTQGLPLNIVGLGK